MTKLTHLVIIRSLILKAELELDHRNTPHADMWHRQISWLSNVLVDYVDCDFMTCVDYDFMTCVDYDFITYVETAVYILLWLLYFVYGTAVYFDYYHLMTVQVRLNMNVIND